MRETFISTAVQFFLILLLLAKDRDDGGKELFQRQRWGGSVILVLISCMAILRFIGVFLGHTQFARSHLSHYVPHFFFLAVIWILFRLKVRQPISDVGFRYKPFLTILLSCVVSVFLISEAFIYAHLYRPFFFWAEYVLKLLVIVPVVEEIIFRGIFYSPFRKKYGPARAVLITALLFAAAHRLPHSDYVGYVGLIALGCLFAWLYERKQSLLYPIIAHSILLTRPILRALYHVSN